MRHQRRERCACLLVGVVFLLAPGQVLAGDGVYLGMDLGVSLAPGPDTATLDNDYPTICDEFINPGDQDVSTCPSGESWTNAFDGGVGVLSGVAMGYRYGNYRFEGEYFYRGTSYNRESEPVFSGATLLKDSQEISESVEAIGDVLSHNFFANLYYDFTSDSKWTPYLGAGVGLALVSVDYSNRFTRSSDPVNIKTFGDTVNDRNRRLAGTTTVASDRLSDTLFGWQAMAGVDYQVSEPVTIGLKLRWAEFGEFEDGAEYRQLRSHDSTNSPDASDPRSARVRYSFTTDDIKFWGASLNMKYQF